MEGYESSYPPPFKSSGFLMLECVYWGVDAGSIGALYLAINSKNNINLVYT